MTAPARAGHDHRIADVDGLRAIAALAVLVYHFYQFDAIGPGARVVAERFGPVLRMGAHGVDLFFVLSGFCLAYPTLVRVRAGEGMRFDLIAFWAKRIVRILPPYWCAIAVSIAILAPFGLADPAASSPAGIAAQALFIDAGKIFVNRSFWTLPIELRWYALFPFALLLYVRAPRALALVAGLALWLEFATRAASVDVGALPLFLAGIWAADLRVRRVAAGGYAIAVALPALVAAIALEPAVGGAFYAIEPIGMLAMTSLVVAAGSSAPVRAMLGTPLLACIGSMSYSLYLINMPIALVCGRLGVPAIAGLPIAVATSAVFYRCFERPFLAGSLRARMLHAIGRALRAANRIVLAPSVLAVAPAEAAAIAPLAVRRAAVTAGARDLPAPN